MLKIFNKTLIAFLCLSNGFPFLEAINLEDQKKAQMVQDLEVIKHHFEAGYAPANWKKEYDGWDINEAFEDAKQQILFAPFISTKQFHQILRNFMNSMKDYHVDALFFSTEASSLPFSVKGVEGRYFIDWVDPIRLPASYYSIRPGDELLKFDERPVEDVIKEIEETASKSSNPNTDRALAEIKLTIRSGKSGDVVPKGPILITTHSSETNKTTKQQLRWNYTPEYVKNPLDFIHTLEPVFTFFEPLGCLKASGIQRSKKCEDRFLDLSRPPFQSKEKPKIELPKIAMASPLHQEIAQEYAGRDGALGSRKSFLPIFGELVWSNDPADELRDTESDILNGEDNEDILFWHAYIFNHPLGFKIGYIRIPHYMLTLGLVEGFGIIIDMMDQTTDALVIDQLHNFGGYVHIQYLLASMLSNQPLQTPYHRIKITQKEAFDAHNTLKLINLIERSLDSNDPEEKDSEETESEKVNFQEVLFLKAYCELILEDWGKGKHLTSPTPILGVDLINPHPKYRYCKPIMMLINEMDFSGGDFMPAILQDSQRALLFGARTAGAGGYVFSFQFPNTNGIASCSYTASIAERVTAQKIENLGVSPDIEYQITSDDIQRGYRGYIDGANQAINRLLQNSEFSY